MKVGPQPITCVRNTSGEEESLRPQIYMGSPQEGDQYYFFLFILCNTQTRDKK